jgi:hypothetical protein
MTFQTPSLNQLDPVKRRLLMALFESHANTNGAYVKAIVIVRAAIRDDPNYTVEADISLSDPDCNLLTLADKMMVRSSIFTMIRLREFQLSKSEAIGANRRSADPVRGLCFVNVD